MYREDPAPIILIGHSMGGLLRAEVRGDAAGRKHPGQPRCHDRSGPRHARRAAQCRALHQHLPVERRSGRRRRQTEPGYHGHYASFDLSEHDEVTHINIDKMDDVHEQLVAKIVQLATTPAKGRQASRCRFAMSFLRTAPIELWDSGTPVVARQAIRCRTLRQLYHVPLWSLTQVNGSRTRRRCCRASASSFRGISCR